MTVCPGIDGLQGGTADLAKQAAGEEVALPSHSSGQVGVQVITVQAMRGCPGASVVLAGGMV